jgi:c-di-GMP-binding flagellar brake protein YcgR
LQIDEISKGGDIELEVRLNGKSMNFQSDVVFIKNHSVLITSIKVDDQTIGFSEQCTINFLYKLDGKLYLWSDVTVKLVRYNGAIYHLIELSGEGKPYNRRDAYRLYIGEEMNISINTSAGTMVLSVLVKDISETGVGFISKEDLDIDRAFRLKLKDHNRLISLSGIIVRKEFLEQLQSTLYGCKFNEKSQILGKFIAYKQAEQLREKNMAYYSAHARDFMEKSQ